MTKNHYREKCDVCGFPARTSMFCDPRVGIEEFTRCVNPDCYNHESDYMENPVTGIRREKALRVYREKQFVTESAEGRQRNTETTTASTA